MIGEDKRRLLVGGCWCEDEAGWTWLSRRMKLTATMKKGRGARIPNLGGDCRCGAGEVESGDNVVVIVRDGELGWRL